MASWLLRCLATTRYHLLATAILGCRPVETEPPMIAISQMPKAPRSTSLPWVFALLERAITDSLSTRRFGKSEMLKILGFFGSDPPVCAFCGTPDISRWDHLIPVTLGGETVLGNMVPACGKCDDSKGQKPYGEWIESAVPGSPASRGVADVQQRRLRIQEYQATFGYSPRPLLTRLTRDEQARLETIRRKTDEVRNELGQLVLDFRARTAA